MWSVEDLIDLLLRVKWKLWEGNTSMWEGIYNGGVLQYLRRKIAWRTDIGVKKYYLIFLAKPYLVILEIINQL